MNRLPAIIFDMDGVLLDSNSVHAAAYEQALQEEGLSGFRYLDYAGMRTNTVIELFLRKKGGEPTPLQVERLTRRKQALSFAKLQAAPPVVRGCRDVLLALSQKYRLALASSAGDHTIHLFLEASRCGDLFSVVRAGSQVAQAKPHPAIYLDTLAALGCAQAWVIEDAVEGVRAAVAAGCPVIGVEGTFPAPELLKVGAQQVVASIQSLGSIL